MTPEMFDKLLLGHFVGDYLLQNQWMALNKSSKFLPGIVHALVYTLAVVAITNVWTLSWITVVFLSHYPVDRFSLADQWLKLINGRTLEGFIKAGHLKIPMKARAAKKNYHILRGGFHSLVYAVTDNTIHILLMYYGWRLI